MANIKIYSGGGSSNAFAIDGLGELDQVAYFIAPHTISSNHNMTWSPDNRILSLNGPETRESTLVIAGNSATDATSAIDVRTSLTYGDITVFKVYDNGRIDSQVLSGTGSGATGNLAIGMNAGANITTGQDNVLVGPNAGNSIGTGASNVFIGVSSGTASNGFDNVAIGKSAMLSATTGTGNVIIGISAADGITTGSANVAIGSQALGNATGGNGANVAIGSTAGLITIDGNNPIQPSSCIYIGSNTRSSGATGSRSNEIVIGTNAIGMGNNTMAIGTPTTGDAKIDCDDLSVTGNVRPAGDIILIDTNIVLNDANGTRIGTSASQKLAFWNKTPIAQPTTSIPPVTIQHNGGGAIGANDTFGGYTLAKVVAALQQVGILA
jgi:hypothetical protein